MAATNPNRNAASGRESPAMHAFVPTQSDTEECEFITRAIYVGNGGSLKVTMAGGETVTFAGVPTGALLPISVKRVWTTGSATGLIGLY
jgi:hypothetical protein